LIDAGASGGFDRVMNNIRAAGLEVSRVKRLVLTHCHVDHSGGVPRYQAMVGVKAVSHARCAEILAQGNDPRTAAGMYGMRLPPIRIDITFDGEEYRLPLGDTELVCIHTPGHSPGSICVYMDRDGQRILFGQDVHGPIHPALDSNREQYKQSLQRLIGLKADVLCEGHFGVYRPREEVEKYIRSYL
jgi:glyoxylase-like metal-dependent hydrolase (beta-lactamase superfamily II)